jgi:hypothetical protein
MKDHTSIKKVLPAIWNHHIYLHSIEDFKEYSATDFEGQIINPYDILISGIKASDNEDDVVKGETEAMHAYYKIRFDDSLNAVQKNVLKMQLLRYCRLDTMAMFVIAHHWGLK